VIQNMSILRIKKLLVGNGIVATIFRTSFTNIAVLLLTTITSIITARMLGVVGRGELAAILFWPSLLSSLINLGLPTSLIYNIKRNADYTFEFIKASMMVLLPISVVTGVISWFFIPIWLSQYSVNAIYIAQLYALIAIPCSIVISILSSFSKAIDKFRIYNGIRLYIALICLLGLLGLWIFGEVSLAATTLVYIGATIIVLYYAYKKLLFKLKFNFKGIFNERVKYLYNYGFRVYGMELLGSLYSQADKLIIITLLPPRDFGLYTVVYAVSRVFNALQIAITEVIFPKVTGKEANLIIETVSKAFRISMVIMLIILIPSLFVGKILLGTLFGNEFLEAASSFYLLSLECIVGGGSWILASSFNAIGRPGLVLVRQIIAITLTISLFFVLTPLYGILGVSIALLSGALVRLFISLIQIPIVFKIPIIRVLFSIQDFDFIRLFLKERIIK
jgi:O-antigen/teichoic acid export membrane protein